MDGETIAALQKQASNTEVSVLGIKKPAAQKHLDPSQPRFGPTRHFTALTRQSLHHCMKKARGLIVREAGWMPPTQLIELSGARTARRKPEILSELSGDWTIARPIMAPMHMGRAIHVEEQTGR